MQNDNWAGFWEEYNNKLDLNEDLSPKEYHLDLKNIINSFKDKKKIIEIGCGTGITSLLLDDSFDKTLLDCDLNALNLAKSLFEKYGKKACFIQADMFSSGVEDESYDIVFNSGVIEHFDYESRIKALKEYKRILKKDGIMLIAYPNHYSLPYRAGYLVLNLIGKWIYPKEFMLYDLKNELKANNLVLRKRLVVANNMLIEHFSSNKILKSVLRFLYGIFRFEGYLTVLIVESRRVGFNPPA